MKSKDQILLEEAYSQVQLNEGLLDTVKDVMLDPIKKWALTSIVSILKSNAPEAFQRLKSAKSPEELQQMVTSNARGASSQEDSAMQEASSLKQKVQSALQSFEREITKKSTFDVVCQVLLTVLGIIAVVGTGGLAIVFAALFYILTQGDR